LKIDLHIHSRDCSDGKMALSDIITEAASRGVGLLSVTDHDNIDCQERAEVLATNTGAQYLCGVELNIAFSHADYRDGKAVSLDLLGYQYDYGNAALNEKLHELREYRKVRAERILEKLNMELIRKGLAPFTQEDMAAIQETAEGALGRPHIADTMVEKGVVKTRQEAFDSYLVGCNVPKMPVSLEEASELIRSAGGKTVLAHPNDPNGTSLVKLTSSLREQHDIIRGHMLPYLDGIECWHSRHDRETVAAYTAFARAEGLLVTGGSDCHQQPVIMGTVDVPDFVAAQFGYDIR